MKFNKNLMNKKIKNKHKNKRKKSRKVKINNKMSCINIIKWNPKINKKFLKKYFWNL